MFKMFPEPGPVLILISSTDFIHDMVILTIIINILSVLFHLPHCSPFPSPPVVPLILKPDQVTLMFTTFPRVPNSKKVGEGLTFSMAYISYMIYHH